MLSEILFGKDKLITINMAEYNESISASKITGSPPGYIGYDDGSHVGEEIRKKPYSVLLLDEIEKAHKDVLKIFLSVFEDGCLSDNMGRMIDFRNTIIIMTSNLSMSNIKSQKTLGFNSSNEMTKEETKSFLGKELRKHFTPEFLNRIDDVVTFDKISKEDINKIFDLEFQHTADRSACIGKMF